MPGSSTPVEVFYSYAHEDEAFRNELEKHLSLLRRQGLITAWHDRHILPGVDWAQAIDEHLERASVILLLISADFLDSDYCYGIEMQRALERHQANEARVIPILLRPVDWNNAPFAHLQALPTDAKSITTWSNQDEAFANVATGIRRVIEDLSSLAASAPRAALPPVWNVPYPQNPLFTGREELLTQLTTTLQAGQPTALSQPQAISGLGGIGKTQLALEYVYRFRQDYQAVLWAQADTREALTASYLAFAALLSLPEKEAQESEHVIAAVKDWLQTHTHWLLILDNADDLALARAFLPPTPGGHLLLTTRAQAMGRFAHHLEVENLPIEQAARFLLHRSGLLAPDATLEQASEHERDTARAICEELGGLPLALDQAGAYIEETGCSLADYQHRYKQHRADLLAERRGMIDDHPQPVATTWSLSFDLVKEANPAAADLLRLCAFLAPDAIPEVIITKGASHLGTLLAPVGADPYLLDRAIEALRAYSLLHRETRSGADNMLSMHRLVQAVLKDQMDEQSRRQWAERTVRAVYAALPDVEHETWPQWERILVHALACTELMRQLDFHFAESAYLLQQTGWYLTERARYSDAEPLLERAYQMSTQEQGAEHLDTARAASTLAYLYREQGKYEQAEPLYVRAIAIYEQQLGPQHPLTAISLDNLAYLYREQGKYEQAEPLVVRALAICEQQLGPQHPDTQITRGNYVALLRMMGRDAEARALETKHMPPS